jgi:C1A family cysteine protease
MKFALAALMFGGAAASTTDMCGVCDELKLNCNDCDKINHTTLSTQPSGMLRASNAAMPREAIEYLFESWRDMYGEEFEPVEHVHRLNVFEQNVYKIREHNAKGEKWTMALNQFGHLTGDEFKAQISSGLKTSSMIYGDIPHDTFDGEGAEIADSVDWTTKGAVTPVKNQAQCGSCWAFSTTGGLEGAYYLKNNKLQSFSEQQLVSCDKTDAGCNGGLMDSAFAWIEQNGGLCSESDYPYTSGTGITGTCKKTCTAVPNSAPSKYTDVGHTQSAMEAAVTQQPVSIAIEADQSSFQFYSGGVMTGNCGTNLDHGVLNVGFGTKSGTDYWKVKNSWGATWGDEGYILLERGKSQSGGQCGLLNSGSYPTM